VLSASQPLDHDILGDELLDVRPASRLRAVSPARERLISSIQPTVQANLGVEQLCRTASGSNGSAVGLS